MRKCLLLPAGIFLLVLEKLTPRCTTLTAGISAILLLGMTYALRRASIRAKIGEDRRRLKEIEGWQPETDREWADENDANHSEADDDMGDGSDRNEVYGCTCYGVLGVPPTSTRAEIEAAFRMKIKATHPDRVAGLDPDIQALADQKTKRLNAARDEAVRRL